MLGALVARWGPYVSIRSVSHRKRGEDRTHSAISVVPTRTVDSTLRRGLRGGSHFFFSVASKSKICRLFLQDSGGWYFYIAIF